MGLCGLLSQLIYFSSSAKKLPPGVSTVHGEVAVVDANEEGAVTTALLKPLGGLQSLLLLLRTLKRRELPPPLSSNSSEASPPTKALKRRELPPPLTSNSSEATLQPGQHHPTHLQHGHLIINIQEDLAGTIGHYAEVNLFSIHCRTTTWIVPPRL